MKYLVTGARGFVGMHLCDYLSAKGVSYRGISRSEIRGPNDVQITDFFSFQNWPALFNDVTVVVHLAAKVHEMSGAPLREYQTMNRDLTEKLAHEAKKAGVKKFIFLSTVKVNGDYTDGHAFTADDTPKPGDPYAVSKMEAENALLKLHQPGVFDVVIIRPPLIYGDGVKANFRTLVNLTKRRLPLPFGAIQNKRSLVSVYNLADLIYTCAIQKQANGNIFLVSDGDDMSLPTLIRKIAIAVKAPAFLVPVPVKLLRWSAQIIGKNDYFLRLGGDLVVNIDKTRKTLQWNPPFSTEESLIKMFRAEAK